MEIIFLDIIWVLIRCNNNSYDFETNLVSNLKKILDKTNAKIVISSDRKYEKILLDWIFKRHKLKYLDTTVINENKGVFISSKITKIREKEILKFLKDYKKKWIQIDNFVVIDDFNLNIKNFFRTNPNIWLNNEITDNIIKHLGQ